MSAETSESELVVETRGLTRRFGRTTAVDGVDLQVPAGSVFGLLGRKAAGKTTTLQLLMGLLEPSAGDLSVLGLDPAKQDVALKRLASYLPAQPRMTDWSRVEQLIEVLRVVHPRFEPKLAAELLDQLGVSPGSAMVGLPRLEQLRVALVLALSSRPRLLILDEPIAELDEDKGPALMDNIAHFVDQSETTVLLATASVDCVKRCADWVGIIDQGKLVLQSPLALLGESVKRVAASFSEEQGEVDLSRALHREIVGQRQTFLVEDFGDDTTEELKQAGGREIKVWDCDLEDIFQTLGRGRSAKTDSKKRGKAS